MKRLQDEIDSKDVELLRDAHLSRALAPHAPSELRKRRVRAAIAARVRRDGARAWWLQPAVMAAVLLGMMAVAGATVGRDVVRRVVERVQEALSAPAATRRDAVSPGRSRPPPPHLDPPPPPPPPVVESSGPVVSPAPLPQEPAPPPAAPAPKGKPPAPAVKPPDPAVAAEDKAPGVLENDLVLDAVNALRRDGDPGRAAMLLSFYLRRHEDGALAEEALALSIEAESAQGTDKAAALAERYLKSYPMGAYRETARRAIRAK